MIEKIQELVRGNQTCVLATVTGGRPHCSLMSYIADPDCRHIYMATGRRTKKYSNLMENPWVSVLIDTREEDPRREVGRTKALTIGGTFEQIGAAEKEVIRGEFLNRHPQLKDLVDDPGTEIFSIRVRSFQLLEGIRDSFYTTMD